MSVTCFVVQALVRLDAGTDPAEVGARVTAALCGHWDHPGPCRWPHNNSIDTTQPSARFRTLFVSAHGEADEAATRVITALASSPGWTSEAVERRDVDPSELALAARLLAGPRAPAD